MARKEAPPNLKDLFSLRVANIPHTVETDDILKEFRVFGEIGDYYRPVLLAKHRYSNYMFIRFVNAEEGQNALESMDGRTLWEVEISVTDANGNDIFFTGDTGFLTNYSMGLPSRPEPEFDGSLPPNHYDVKRKEKLRLLDECYTVRVDDLHPSITTEELEQVFASCGEIARIYRPLNLTKQPPAPRELAFVRFVSPHGAQRALQQLQGIRLHAGRPLTLLLNYQKTYFSQDESSGEPRKKKPGVVMHFDPY